MTRDLVTVDQEDSIFDVAEICKQRSISGVPVLNSGKLVGVVSVSDIIRFMTFKLRQENIIARDPDLESLLIFAMLKMGTNIFNFKKELARISRTKVKDVMSKKLVTISPEQGLFDAANLMQKKSVNRLLVVENENLIGIIARQDLIRELVK